jgi:hypothetical protein
LAKSLRRVFPPEVILDGELYKHGWPLQRILSAVTPVRGEPNEDTALVEYHVFDVVDFSKSFEDRGRIQQEIAYVRNLGGLVTNVLTGKALDEVRANQWYVQFVEDGYEGMMYRLGDCPYTVPKQLTERIIVVGNWKPKTGFLSDKNNRTWHLLKRKDWKDDEFEFLSIRETTGDLGEPGFVVTVRSKSDTIPYFDIGSGLSQAEVQHYLSNPPYGHLVKVKYLVLSNDGIPQNPSILAIL